jgi:hypothetical protein
MQIQMPRWLQQEYILEGSHIENIEGEETIVLFRYLLAIVTC